MRELLFVYLCVVYLCICAFVYLCICVFVFVYLYLCICANLERGEDYLSWCQNLSSQNIKVTRGGNATSHPIRNILTKGFVERLNLSC